MAPPSKFAEAQADRETIKLNLDTLSILLSQDKTTPLDLQTATDSLDLSKKAQQQLMDNQRVLSTYAPTKDVLQEYSDEYPTELTRAIRCCSGFRGIVMKLTPACTSSPSSASSSNQPDIRLPRLEIPQFSGNLEEWISFRDIFENAIHKNSSISKAQKLTYLRSYLTGEAAGHIATLVISDANYDVAWTTLTNRYQNERVLLFSLLNRIINQPVHQFPSAADIRKLIDTTQGAIRSLEFLQVPVQHWDVILVYIMFNKLDQSSRELWEHSITNTKIPALKDLIDFLEQRARALTAGSSIQPFETEMDRYRPITSHHTRTHSTSSSPSPCPLSCRETHPLFRCNKFRDMDVRSKIEILKRYSLCFNCFGTKHGVTACKSSHSCRVCGKRHHTMIHQDSPQNTAPPQASSSTNEVPSYHVRNQTLETAILATARVCVKDKHGKDFYLRLLLDGGSPVSFIEEHCARKLHLQLSPSDTAITGVGSASAGVAQAITSFVMKPHFSSQVSYTVNAFVLRDITKLVPQSKLDNKDWSHLHHLRLADPDYASPAPVDILIGSDLFWTIVQLQKIEGPPKAPYAISSTLGWLVAGQSSQQQRQISSYMVNINLEETVQKFWEAETVPSIPLHTKEERECEEYFNNTLTREQNGNFCVSIPWKTPRPQLGASKQQAMQRLFQLERRFKHGHLKDTEKIRMLAQHHEDYIKFMDEYEQLNHMSLVPNNELNKPAVYIPHHFVVKESTTTRLRVVFDASAKTSSGISLNEAMMIGPTLQDPIQDILLRFRKHNIAFTADIAKMYRQISMNAEDRDMQRILWRKHPSHPIKEYRLNTVTYGTAAAPYLAVKCLQQLAVIEAETYPLASQVALHDFYVDDAASGGSTVSAVIETVKQLNAMCNKANFPLRKYSSNSMEVLQNIPAELRETSSEVEMDSNNQVKTLGIIWQPKNDCYKFTINLPRSSAQCTKRSILSEVSMIFDPIGWLSPVIICGKLLIQELWKAKLDWNDPVPDNIQEKWIALKESFKVIEKLSIPRCILPGAPTSTVLVGFSDASSYAYSACVYTVCFYNGQEPFSTLVTSKTKVAPINSLTIPRLELNAAVLLASLMSSVIRAVKHNFTELRCYTDSTIVLAWINSSSLRWKTYVRQRVQKIQDTIPEATWHHVRSEENCADCASRGLTPYELVNHTLWWKGNEQMLVSTPVSFTTPSDSVFDPVRGEEQKQLTVHFTAISGFDNMISSFSSFRRIQRVVSWIYRFVNNARTTQNNRKFIPLTVAELTNARDSIIRHIQATEYKIEVFHLQKGNNIPSTSKILSLTPFLDKCGVLRVGGRIQNAEISEDMKHPILLPPRHRVCQMILSDYHINYFHAGAQLLHTLLQRKYWISSARDIIRHHVRKCVTCIRYRGETMKQIMGNIPSERVNPSPPFIKCGVDYAGPVYTKPPVRSKVVLKSYLSIFICMATKAMHIEIVESLSTDSFLAALRRFTSTRGRPTDIYSDCGTNFVGANRAIKEFVQLCATKEHNQKVADSCSSDGIQWHFNPANTPHFGGLWEAGVKSVKYHLNRVMGSSRYTYEELLTLMKQIEALLNSRPLVPASTDPADFQVITPAHFLTGRPTTAIPDGDFVGIPEGRLSRWQHIQQQQQHFWRRWSSEYIARLQQRPKWMQQSSNIKINDLVIIKEDNLPPTQWRLGRVIMTHPGKDGNTRVVTLRTAHGQYKRSIHKLCLLSPESPPPATSEPDAE